MGEEQIALLGVTLAAAIGIAVIIFVSRRTAAIREVLGRSVSAAGWSGVGNVFLSAAGVKGTWRSFPVRLLYHQRQKGTPERLVLKVRARTDARLIVRRKVEGLFGNRPLTWFGPPLIDLHQREAGEFWICGDEPALAERLFSDSNVVRKIAANLLAPHDEVRIGRRGLKVTRALDTIAQRVKYGAGLMGIRFDPTRYETIAREELALAEALVVSVGFRPGFGGVSR